MINRKTRNVSIVLCGLCSKPPVMEDFLKMKGPLEGWRTGERASMAGLLEGVASE